MSEARHQRFEIDIDEIERQLRESADMAPAAKPDPLAELARIVGQNDPFRGILGDRRIAPEASKASSLHVVPRDDREPAPEHDRIAEAQDAGYGAYDRIDTGYDPIAATYGSADGALDEDDLSPLQPRRSRGRLVAVIGILAVASAAAAGGLYWKRSAGGSTASGNPPVIAADTAPLKVAPENPGGVDVPNQNKQIYDRKAPDGQSRVVDTREQPMDVREAVRNMPASGQPPLAANGSTSARVSGTPSPNAVSSALGEPVRVRTSTVRPDGSIYVPPGSSGITGDSNQRLLPGDTPPPPVSVTTVAVPTRQAAPGSSTGGAGLGSARPSAALSPTPSAPVTTSETSAASGAEGAPVGQPIKVLPPRRPKLSDAGLDAAEPQAQEAALAPEPTVRAATPRPVAEKPAAIKVAAASQEKPAAEKPADGKGNFNVQVAVRDSDLAARSAWTEMLDKYPGDLEGRPARVSQADVNGKTVYRVRVGPYTKGEANTLCNKLKSAGGKCFLAAN